MNPVKKLVSFSKSDNGLIIIEKIPFFILSLLSYFLSMISMSKFHIVINYSLIPLDLRIYNLFVSIIRYVWNMVWPVELSIFTSFSQSHSPLAFLIVAPLRPFCHRRFHSPQKKTPLVHRGLALVSHGPVARQRLDSSRALAGDGKPVHVHPDDRPVYPPCVGMRRTDQGTLLATHESHIVRRRDTSTLCP